MSESFDKLGTRGQFVDIGQMPLYGMSEARDIVHFLNLRIGSTPVSSWDSKAGSLEREWLRPKSQNGLRQGKYQCILGRPSSLIKNLNALIYKEFILREQAVSPMLTGIIVVI
ncbi:hypothetical protein [Burkholderia sp. Ax-1719]|uniref:hypothetical protein n=1 Tax=Burkholderia sp. Ax-1719 TaxID=2608334 RepID=UPI00141DF8A9|nr:hypothetical protein [Burkholderia sp. Ax-1719]NIE67856.1 hypothetical protein [Burkholderia sp. Ax-1719]